jgi:hypothetical protein
MNQSATITINPDFHVDSSTQAVFSVHDDQDDDLLATITIDWSNNDLHKTTIESHPHTGDHLAVMFAQEAHKMLDSFYSDEVESMPSMTLGL